MVGLTAATVGGAALRLTGLGVGLPFQSDPDAVIVQQALALERGAPRTGENAISPLYPHLLALSLVALPGAMIDWAPAEGSFAQHARAAARPHLLARRWLALLATLVLPGVYCLARRFLPPAWALFAVCLLATSLLHLMLSRQARPHGPLTAFSVWTLVSAVHLAKRPSSATIGACCLGAALTVGALHSGAAVMPAVALACLVAARRARARLRVACALPLAAALASYLWFYPFASAQGVLASRRAMTVAAFDGSGFLSIARSAWAFDPTMSVLAVAGAVYACAAARRRHARGERWWTVDAALVAAFALPYLAVLGSYYRTLHRFTLPLIPLGAVLGAAGAMALARGVAGSSRAPLLARHARLLVVGAALALPTAAATRWVWLSLTPNTADLAARWIEEHASPDAEVIAVSGGVHLPLPQDREGMATAPKFVRSPMQRYLEAHPASPCPGPTFRLRPLIPPAVDGRLEMGEESVAVLLAELAPRYAVVSPPRHFAAVEDGSRAAVLTAGGERLARFEPYPVRADMGVPRYRRGGPLGYQAFAFALRSPLRGGPIEIYRLP